MDLSSVRSAYRRYAGAYDVVFGPVLNPGRVTAVPLVNNRPRQRVLEVGVGTGLSLGYYRKDAQVVGIDVSPEMLSIARRRVEQQRLTHVESLHEMDAENLQFPDASFDLVLALYVASVVPNPHRLVAEMRRVCRPGGELVIVNHFSGRTVAMRAIERGLAPLSRLLGFRTSFPLDAFLRDTEFTPYEIRPTNLLGYWTMLRARNGGPVPSAMQIEPAAGQHRSRPAEAT
jgi:phosphatidylethanolamine/phosphatidyl-N-methylethanolamine N-methyltransferase